MALGDDLEVVEDVKLHEDVDVAGLRGGNMVYRMHRTM